MPTWNLHLVGHDLEESLASVIAKLQQDLADIGHVLDTAVLTTDSGSVDLASPPPPAPAEPAVPTEEAPATSSPVDPTPAPATTESSSVSSTEAPVDTAPTL